MIQLSEMVGTTRPRANLFMQRFHNLGLIGTNRDRFLIIKKKAHCFRRPVWLEPLPLS
jgi:hypothetical protein